MDLPHPLNISSTEGLERARRIILSLEPSQAGPGYPSGSEYEANVKAAARKMLTYLPGAPLELVGKPVDPTAMELNLRHEEAKESLPPMSTFELQVLRTYIRALREQYVDTHDSAVRETIEALEGTIGHLQGTGKMPKDIPVVRRSRNDDPTLPRTPF